MDQQHAWRVASGFQLRGITDNDLVGSAQRTRETIFAKKDF
jgi:hypothetical protein